jgi:hypothetical protein
MVSSDGGLVIPIGIAVDAAGNIITGASPNLPGVIKWLICPSR